MGTGENRERCVTTSGPPWEPAQLPTARSGPPKPQPQEQELQQLKIGVLWVTKAAVFFLLQREYFQLR